MDLSLKNIQDSKTCQHCSESLQKSFILKCNHVFCKTCIARLAEINVKQIANTHETHGIICSVQNCNHFSSTGDIVTKVDEDRLTNFYDNFMNLKFPKVEALTCLTKSGSLQTVTSKNEMDNFVPLGQSFASSTNDQFLTLDDIQDKAKTTIESDDDAVALDYSVRDTESNMDESLDYSVRDIESHTEEDGTSIVEENDSFTSSCEYISLDCLPIPATLQSKLAEMLTSQKSYRSTDINLTSLPTNDTKRISGFMLQKHCEKICFIDDRLWCACPRHNCIDVYTLQGDLVRSIILDAVERPRAIHPYNDDNILVAARSGLYTVNKKTGGLISRNAPGTFRDVHGCGKTIVALQKVKSTPFTEFHIKIFQPTIPLTKVGTITVGNDALSLLVTEQHIFFSSGFYFGANHNIIKYTLKGYYVAKSGRKALSTDAEVGALKWPYICVSDHSGSILVADHGHNRLQIFSGENCWAVVKGVNVENPRDVLIVDKQIIINSNFTNIEIYQI